MTQTNKNFTFISIQPVFATKLLLLSEYFLQNIINQDDIDNHQHFIFWLLGKICPIMLSGLLLDSFRMNYINKLKICYFCLRMRKTNN